MATSSTPAVTMRTTTKSLTTTQRKIISNSIKERAEQAASKIRRALAKAVAQVRAQALPTLIANKNTGHSWLGGRDITDPEMVDVAMDLVARGDLKLHSTVQRALKDLQVAHTERSAIQRKAEDNLREAKMKLELIVRSMDLDGEDRIKALERDAENAIDQIQEQARQMVLDVELNGFAEETLNFLSTLPSGATIAAGLGLKALGPKKKS